MLEAVRVPPTCPPYALRRSIIPNKIILICKFSINLTVKNTSVTTVRLGLLYFACTELTFDFEATKLDWTEYLKNTWKDSDGADDSAKGPGSLRKPGTGRSPVRRVKCSHY